MKSGIYDCVVIGAGIAGLMAARQLEKQGLDYICIDKKKKIGHPLRCGEAVCKKTFDRFFGSKKYIFIKSLITKNKFKILLNNKVAERTLNIPYYQLDRPKFEQWLAKDIKKKIILNCACEDLKKQENIWILKTKNRRIKAKTIILALGCDFKIQRATGLIDRIPSLAVLYFGLFNNAKINKDELLFLYSNKFLAGLWAFPKRDGLINAGIGTFQKTNINLKSTFYDITKKLKELENMKLSYVTGGIEPADGPIKRTFADGLLVAGDAAGFVYAFSGEGIKYAMISGYFSGNIISDAIKKDDFSSRFLSAYERAWKKEFGVELKAGLILKDIALWVYKRHPNLVEKLFMFPSDKDLYKVKNGILPLKVRLIHLYIKARKHNA